MDKLVCFDYRKGRGREGPELFLEGFQGTLQTDGYAGTCKINNVEPLAWLKDVLTWMPDHSIHKLEELLPGYQPENSE